MGLHDRTFQTAAPEPTMETATLVHAADVVRQLLVYLKANPIVDDRILDIDDLPSSKSSLVNAFRLLIAGETRSEQRGQLQKVGLLLAQFQLIGEKTKSAQADEDADDPLASWIDTVADETESDSSPWLAVFREQERLAELFDISARMAERRSIFSYSAPDNQRPADVPTH